MTDIDFILFVLTWSSTDWDLE